MFAVSSITISRLPITTIVYVLKHKAHQLGTETTRLGMARKSWEGGGEGHPLLGLGVSFLLPFQSGSRLPSIGNHDKGKVHKRSWPPGPCASRTCCLHLEALTIGEKLQDYFSSCNSKYKTRKLKICWHTVPSFTTILKDKSSGRKVTA